MATRVAPPHGSLEALVHVTWPVTSLTHVSCLHLYAWLCVCVCVTGLEPIGIKDNQLTPAQWALSNGMAVYVNDYGPGSLEYYGPLEIDGEIFFLDLRGSSSSPLLAGVVHVPEVGRRPHTCPRHHTLPSRPPAHTPINPRGTGPNMIGAALKKPKGTCNGENPKAKKTMLFRCKVDHGVFVEPSQVFCCLRLPSHLASPSCIGTFPGASLFVKPSNLLLVVVSNHTPWYWYMYGTLGLPEPSFLPSIERRRSHFVPSIPPLLVWIKR